MCHRNQQCLEGVQKMQIAVLGPVAAQRPAEACTVPVSPTGLRVTSPGGRLNGSLCHAKHTRADRPSYVASVALQKGTSRGHTYLCNGHVLPRSVRAHTELFIAARVPPIVPCLSLVYLCARDIQSSLRPRNHRLSNTEDELGIVVNLSHPQPSPLIRCERLKTSSPCVPGTQGDEAQDLIALCPYGWVG